MNENLASLHARMAAYRLNLEQQRNNLLQAGHTETGGAVEVISGKLAAVDFCIDMVAEELALPWFTGREE